MGKEKRVSALHAVDKSEAVGPIPLAPEKYWRIRAALLERDAMKRQIEAAAEKANADVIAAFTDAGLDLQVNYKLDDATCSAVKA